MKRIIPLLLVFSFLCGCSLFVIDEPEETPQTTESSVPLPVPTAGSARSSLFGLVWMPVDKVQPFTDRSRYNQDVYRLVYEPLFIMDESFNPAPVLCESMVTEDNMTFLITIKSDVLFHNGEPLTPQDVVYSLNQARLSGSLFTDKLNKVRKITVIDEKSVEVTLTSPQIRFSALLDMPIVPDKSVAEKIPSGTGPFEFAYEGGDEEGQLPGMYLTAGSNWRGSAQPVLSIQLVSAETPDELIYGFEVGGITMLSTDPFDTMNVNIRGGFESWSYPTARIHYIGYNTKREPFSKPEFRRAVSQAVDRESIGRDVFDGYYDAAVLPCPNISGYVSDYVSAGFGYDLRETARLFGELNIADNDADGIMEYPAGRKRTAFSAELLVCSENFTACNAAQSVADMLSQQGLPVTLRRLPYKGYTEALQKGDFDFYYGMAQLSGDFDPGVFLRDGELRHGGFSNNELSGLYNAMQSAGDAEGLSARNLFYTGFLENAPVSPLLFTRRRMIAERGVLSNPTPTDSGLFYNFMNWKITK